MDSRRCDAYAVAHIRSSASFGIYGKTAGGAVEPVAYAAIPVADRPDILRSHRYVIPVFRFGGLEGKVKPREAAAIVSAYGASVTATAIPDNAGRYCIRGLDAGMYKLVFDAGNGYIDTTISSVQVSKGRRTRVADIVLKK